MAIIDYWTELSTAERIEFRKLVLDATGMAYSSFYYKLRFNQFTKSETTVILNLIKDYARKD